MSPRPAPRARAFWELRLRVPARAGEAVANFLIEEGAPGILEDTPRGVRGVTFRAPFGSRPRAAVVARSLGRFLRALRDLGTLRGPIRIALGAVRGSDWAQRWKRYVRPVRIGRRLIVGPSWAATARAGTATVSLDPGMAFGTGGHASTRLCLEALARHLRGGERVLDLGTGSGILAIAAAKLGARVVLAVDTDPLACRIARENARRNGVGRRVRVRHGALGGCAAQGFDLAVANLTARDLAAVLPDLASRVRPGGLVVLSGLLRAQESAGRRAARAAGLGPAAGHRRGGWVALEVRRPLSAGTRGRPSRARL